MRGHICTVLFPGCTAVRGSSQGRRNTRDNPPTESGGPPEMGNGMLAEVVSRRAKTRYHQYIAKGKYNVGAG